MRIKFRYIICRLTSSTFRENEISESIHSSVREFFGLCGEGRMLNRFRIVYCNEETQLVVIRILSEAKSNILYALTMLKKIKDRPAVFDIVGISGSQRGAQKQILDCYSTTFI